MNPEHPEIQAVLDGWPLAVDGHVRGDPDATDFLTRKVMKRVGGYDREHVERAICRAAPLFSVGEKYDMDELPDNQMNESGKLEWVSDDVLALAYRDYVVEFEMCVKCTSVSKLDEHGNIETISGERS